MHILLTGATGFVGATLTPLLLQHGHTVTAFTRDPDDAARREPRVRWRPWTPKTPGPWQRDLDGVDAVIHLAGKGIFDDRWTDAVRQELRDSRILSTRLITQAIAQAASPPRVLISGSAVGYYGDRDLPTDEDTPPGHDFLAQLCVDWEREALAAQDLGVRVVTLRTGIVLGHGGALEQMARPFKLFVGGPVGDGKQHMAWVHIRDLCGLILFVLERDDASGPLNGVAPHPVTMNTFAEVLGQVLRRPAAFRVPSFALKLAAGDASEVLLGGQNATPRRALDLGYTFRFSQLREALQDLLSP